MVGAGGERAALARQNSRPVTPPNSVGRQVSSALSAGELRDLAATGPGATDLLNKRLRALGIAPLEIAAVPGLKPALERCCSMCDSKSECARDLRTDPTFSILGAVLPE